MKVTIREDKLSAESSNGTIYKIKHISNTGEDITGLAEMASKSHWWDIDRPWFKPGTIQEAYLLDDGMIIIDVEK